jgi:hypothetical protein
MQRYQDLLNAIAKNSNETVSADLETRGCRLGGNPGNARLKRLDRTDSVILAAAVLPVMRTFIQQ